MKEVLRVGQWDSINWFLTNDDRFLPKGFRALLLTGGPPLRRGRLEALAGLGEAGRERPG
jgi:hypothetical protein